MQNILQSRVLPIAICVMLNRKRTTRLRTKYIGFPYTDDHAFDAELVDKLITELKHNKAAGLDNLTAVYLQFSHPIVVSVMCTRFNIMMSYGYVPARFGRSYTIPLPKVTPFWVKHLWLMTLGAYLLAQFVENFRTLMG